MTKDEMFHKLTLRYEELVCKYADKNVTDEQFFNELCCSVYAGHEFEETEHTIKLDDELCFEYKGYKFELTSCNMLVSGTQIKQLDGVENYRDTFPHGIFSDRYVCWMYGHKDDNGITREQTDEPECWCPKIYLVPEAWAWGADSDCLPNEPVDSTIFKAIDKFLEQNPDL